MSHTVGAHDAVCVTVRVPRPLWEELSALAERRGCFVADLLRELAAERLRQITARKADDVPDGNPREASEP